MDHAIILAKPTAGEAPRLSPLEAFVAWLANFLRTLAGLKRRTVFPPNWKDHWPGLRELEWYRDQILAFSAQHVLAGGSLDDRTDFQLILEVPEDYGICPKTPRAMNQRFIAMAQFRLDPDKYIQRHIRRIAKREAIELHTSRDPLRHATKTSRATSPAARWRQEAPVLASLSRHATGGGGMRVLHAHDGGGLAFARGPPSHIPYSLFPTASARSAPENAPSHPLTSRAVCTRYPASNGGTHMKSAKHA